MYFIGTAVLEYVNYTMITNIIIIINCIIYLHEKYNIHTFFKSSRLRKPLDEELDVGL